VYANKLKKIYECFENNEEMEALTNFVKPNSKFIICVKHRFKCDKYTETNWVIKIMNFQSPWDFVVWNYIPLNILAASNSDTC
jgi:hypothetical protein